MKDFLANRPKLQDEASQSILAVQGLGALGGASGQVSSPIASCPNGHDPAAPDVDLNYDAEGRVKEIRITCRCGEIITLRCVY